MVVLGRAVDDGDGYCGKSTNPVHALLAVYRYSVVIRFAEMERQHCGNLAGIR